MCGDLIPVHESICRTSIIRFGLEGLESGSVIRQERAKGLCEGARDLQARARLEDIIVRRNPNGFVPGRRAIRRLQSI